MQRVLITGALGYLGQTVLKRLHKDLEAGKNRGFGRNGCKRSEAQKINCRGLQLCSSRHSR